MERKPLVLSHNLEQQQQKKEKKYQKKVAKHSTTPKGGGSAHLKDFSVQTAHLGLKSEAEMRQETLWSDTFLKKKLILCIVTTL